MRKARRWLVPRGLRRCACATLLASACLSSAADYKITADREVPLFDGPFSLVDIRLRQALAYDLIPPAFPQALEAKPAEDRWEHLGFGCLPSFHRFTIDDEDGTDFCLPLAIGTVLSKEKNISLRGELVYNYAKADHSNDAVQSLEAAVAMPMRALTHHPADSSVREVRLNLVPSLALGTSFQRGWAETGTNTLHLGFAGNVEIEMQKFSLTYGASLAHFQSLVSEWSRFDTFIAVQETVLTQAFQFSYGVHKNLALEVFLVDSRYLWGNSPVWWHDTLGFGLSYRLTEVNRNLHLRLSPELQIGEDFHSFGLRFGLGMKF